MPKGPSPACNLPTLSLSPPPLLLHACPQASMKEKEKSIEGRALEYRTREAKLTAASEALTSEVCVWGGGRSQGEPGGPACFHVAEDALPL